MLIKATIALYHSDDPEDEVYWDIAQTAKDFGITITPTGKYDWGGEAIFDVEGTPLKLNNFAEQFCSVDTIADLVVSNDFKELR